jgi:hypothetical protein
MEMSSMELGDLGFHSYPVICPGKSLFYAIPLLQNIFVY